MEIDRTVKITIHLNLTEYEARSLARIINPISTLSPTEIKLRNTLIIKLDEVINREIQGD